jgi:hypothetical protein
MTEGPGRIHFVFVRQGKLRGLEEDFSDGIAAQLPGWQQSREELRVCRGAVNITFFIYRRAHIFMSHGVSDKNYLLRRDGEGGLEINKYRIVGVPGAWMKRKLLRHPDLKLKSEDIAVVGWPRLDALLEARKRRNKFRLPFRKKNLLWAPTLPSPLRGEPYASSFPAFEQYTDVLSKHFNYTISVHPSVRGGGAPTFEALLDADVVIADRGTLVYESFALGKPVIFPDWIVNSGIADLSSATAETEIFQKGIGLHARNIDELVELAHLAKGTDRATRDFIADYIDPNTYGRSYKLLAEAARRIWDSGKLKIGKRVKNPLSERGQLAIR